MTVSKRVLVNTLDGRYGFFNTSTGAFQDRGTFGTQLTDVSYAPNGNLYGIDFGVLGFGQGRLYLLDPSDGSRTLIGDVPVGDANGFLMRDDDTAIVTTVGGEWVEFNIITGDIEYQTTLPDSVASAGDVTFLANRFGGFDFLVSVIDGSGDTQILRYSYDADGNGSYDLSTLPLSDVFGMAWAGAKEDIAYLFSGSVAYRIDTDEKTFHELEDLADSGFGAVAGASDVVNASYYQDLANYLVWGYWGEDGRGEAPHAFVQDTITVNIAAMSNAQKALIRQALKAWEDVADVNFRIRSTGNEDITFERDTGKKTATDHDATGNTTNTALINLNPADFSGWDVGDWSFSAIAHEIGHALGLGHPGNYNFGPTRGGNGGGVLFSYDGLDVSIMSYVDPARNSNTDADWGFRDGTYPITPMLADIAAAQILYGAADPVRTGNTVYGFNTNLNGARWQIDDIGRKFAMTIVDGGGRDELNFSGFQQDQIIRLADGAFSSVGGNVNNLAIMAGTMIENARGGSGNDLLRGNAKANQLRGGDGNDDLLGNNGADTIYGGRGKDELLGQNGRDDLSGGRGRDILKGGTGNDTLAGGDGIDRFVFKTGWEVDTIQDFDARGHVHDRLDLSALVSVRNWSDLKNNHLVRDGSDMLINGGHGDRIVLEDVSRSDLDAGDFIF